MLQTELQELGFDWAIRILKHQVRIQMSFWTPWNALIYHWKLYDCTGFWSMEKLELDENSIYLRCFRPKSDFLFQVNFTFFSFWTWIFCWGLLINKSQKSVASRVLPSNKFQLQGTHPRLIDSNQFLGKISF